jgi:hypothetical protein
MTTMTDQTAEVPVRKIITVKASAQRAFHVFTQEFDTWWPRSHHIGKAPMKQAFIYSSTTRSISGVGIPSAASS